MSRRVVGIDVRMWSHPGIGRYIRELVGALLAKPRDLDFELLADVRTEQSMPAAVRDRSVRIKTTRSGIYSLAEQWEIPQKARGTNLLHVPHFNVPVFLGQKLIVTVHDLLYLREPRTSKYPGARFYADTLFKTIRRKASAILAVSEYTKQDLLNYDPKISPDRVFVTYEAPSAIFRKISDVQHLEAVREKYALTGPFILFVGSLKPHKNVPTLIRAVKLLKETKRIRHELVLAGRPDPANRTLFDEIRENTSFVRFLGEVPDEDLPVLYNLAEMFVLPSFWEGFGLPVLEAMACGTPVIISNRTCLPEIAGDAALLFEPSQVDALSGLIYNVLSDRELQTQLAADGFKRAACFSWAKTAEETLRVYQRILS